MESKLEPIISEWEGLKVGTDVQNRNHGWNGTLRRLYKDSSGEMVGVVEVLSGGQKHEMEEFAADLDPINEN